MQWIRFIRSVTTDDLQSHRLL